MTGTTLPQVNMNFWTAYTSECYREASDTWIFHLFPYEAPIGADRIIYLTHCIINLDNFIEKCYLILSLKWISAYAAWSLWDDLIIFKVYSWVLILGQNPPEYSL